MNKAEIEQEIAEKMAKKLAKGEEAKKGKKLKLPSPKGRKGSPKRGASPQRGASPNRAGLLSPNVGARNNLASPNRKASPAGRGKANRGKGGKPKSPTGSKKPKSPRKEGEAALQHVNDDSKLLETRMYSQNINMPVQKPLQLNKKVFLRQSFIMYQEFTDQDIVYFHFENHEEKETVKAYYKFKLEGFKMEDEQEPGVWLFELKPGFQLVKRMVANTKLIDKKTPQKDEKPNEFTKVTTKFEFYV